MYIYTRKYNDIYIHIQIHISAMELNVTKRNVMRECNVIHINIQAGQ